MEIIIKNCNNIEEGNIEIIENTLNIKYGINGTGKSSIAKSIQAQVEDDDDLWKSLIPFKHVSSGSTEKPSIEGVDSVSKIAIFNENYTNQYVFNKSELVENSFEIFIKTDDYEKQLSEIEKLLEVLNQSFQSQDELEELMSVCGKFIEGFGKAQSGYSKAGPIEKSLGSKGNILEDIPKELISYTGYLKSSDNIKWLKWQLSGESYLNIVDNQCPYCTNTIAMQKDSILKIKDTYDTTTITHLNNILKVFETLMPYFSEITAIKVEEITKNVSGMNDAQKNYLVEIKEQISTFLAQLNKLKNLNFYSLKSIDKLSDELSNYKIDLGLYSHINSTKTKEKIYKINASFDQVLGNIGKLQRAVAIQKNNIKKTIENQTEDINNFLFEAGYKYKVFIVETPNNNYQLVLKHIDALEKEVDSAKSSLSFGERNALALILFMYGALKDNPDLIILDDPISSFDGNKKFAIINRIFRGKNSFQGKTVLLLTHEFNTVIDVIYNLPRYFTPIPKAFFVTTKSGKLEESAITKEDIQLFKEIALSNMGANINMLNKLVYLRRLLEVEGNKNLAWNIISSLFHKRDKPTKKIYDTINNKSTEEYLSQEEIEKGESEIKEYLPEFDYNEIYKNTQDKEIMKQKYIKSLSNYEKLHIYRIMYNDKRDSSVIRKFVNETFHIENDSIFQLNPNRYDTVPQYVIDECDKVVLGEQ